MNSESRHLFFRAVRKGDIEKAAELLREFPTLANERIRGDATLLNEQVWRKGVIVAMAHDDTRDSPALHHAVFHGNIEMATMLLQNGADVHALGYENNHESTPPVVLAAWEGGLEMLRLLLENGADPNARSGNDVTPLSTAKRHGHSDRVALLKEFGAVEK